LWTPPAGGAAGAPEDFAALLRGHVLRAINAEAEAG
jgi:hypothetical protein